MTGLGECCLLSNAYRTKYGPSSSTVLNVRNRAGAWSEMVLVLVWVWLMASIILLMSSGTFVIFNLNGNNSDDFIETL